MFQLEDSKIEIDVATARPKVSTDGLQMLQQHISMCHQLKSRFQQCISTSEDVSTM